MFWNTGRCCRLQVFLISSSLASSFPPLNVHFVSKALTSSAHVIFGCAEYYGPEYANQGKLCRYRVWCFEFESQPNETSGNSSSQLRTGVETRQSNKLTKSLEQYTNGIITPLASEEKNDCGALASQNAKNSHHEFEYKLKKADTKGRQLHRLAFRCGLVSKYDNQHPTSLWGLKLKDAFLRHLTPVKKPSPFISIFESFLPALQRALKSEEDASISIIHLHQVEKDLRKRFPEAIEVLWPIKVIIKRYEFKLRNHYRGNEWLVYGAIEKSAIVQTVKVSHLRDIARTGRIRHMRDILDFINYQQHAFGLSDNLPIKYPKTSYRTGQLVGRVLDHIEIPDGHKAILARKVKNVMQFKHSLSLRRQRAYLKGVYNPNHPDSDSDSDGLDDFLVESDEDCHSDDTFCHDSDSDDLSRIKRKTARRESSSSTDGTEIDDSSGMEEEDEQALLDAQLHATLEEWIDAPPASLRRVSQFSHMEVPVLTAEASRKTIRISHVAVPKLTAAQRAEYKIIKPAAEPARIDLTLDVDDELDPNDDDVIVVQPWTTKAEVTIIAIAKKVGRSMNLPMRSTSFRSTIGPGRGLARLEADAEGDVVEVMQFD